MIILTKAEHLQPKKGRHGHDMNMTLWHDAGEHDQLGITAGKATETICSHWLPTSTTIDSQTFNDIHSRFCMLYIDECPQFLYASTTLDSWIFH